MPIEFVATDSLDALKPRITVIGVGGAGCNAIANMIQSDVAGVDYVVANTDAQALNNMVRAENRKIQLGPEYHAGSGRGIAARGWARRGGRNRSGPDRTTRSTA